MRTRDFLIGTLLGAAISVTTTYVAIFGHLSAYGWHIIAYKPYNSNIILFKEETFAQSRDGWFIGHSGSQTTNELWDLLSHSWRIGNRTYQTRDIMGRRI